MDDILQTTYISPFVSEKIFTLVEISPKFVRKGPIVNNSVLVKVMAWYWRGHNPLPGVT